MITAERRKEINYLLQEAEWSFVKAAAEELRDFAAELECERDALLNARQVEIDELQHMLKVARAVAKRAGVDDLLELAFAAEVKS